MVEDRSVRHNRRQMKDLITLSKVDARRSWPKTSQQKEKRKENSVAIEEIIVIFAVADKNAEDTCFWSI